MSAQGRSRRRQEDPALTTSPHPAEVHRQQRAAQDATRAGAAREPARARRAARRRGLWRAGRRAVIRRSSLGGHVTESYRADTRTLLIDRCTTMQCLPRRLTSCFVPASAPRATGARALRTSSHFDSGPPRVRAGAHGQSDASCACSTSYTGILGEWWRVGPTVFDLVDFDLFRGGGR